jgi:lipoprotein-anchoring transpeptidase ErfK/SrfK
MDAESGDWFVFRDIGDGAPDDNGSRARRNKLVAGAIGLAAIAAVAASGGWMLLAGSGNAGTADRPDAAPARQAVAATPTTSTASPFTPAAVTTVATVLRTASQFSTPGQVAAGSVPATWYGRPSVLPVIATKPGWIQVRLAQRPNGTTSWLPDTDVKLAKTTYQIVVQTGTNRLSLYDHGKLVFSAPAGVGAKSDPTPAGAYFVAFDEPPPQPNPGYGPFIMVTSAHSTSITDWDGSGDAVIGIHGPLGDDKEIGTAGAKLSHGCIRLHDQVLQELAKVPPGTPIYVAA